jgi:hypothetical protein
MMPSIDRLRSGAEKVLRTNDQAVAHWRSLGSPGRFTKPHPRQYPHLWLWDSALAALGWLAMGQNVRAQEELETLLIGQSATGLLPHITYNPDPQALALYFPGPDKWQSTSQHGAATSCITQPPLPPFCAWQVYLATQDQTWLARVFQPYFTFLKWLWTARRDADTNLLFLVHPWESGTDNSPIFDEPLARVNLEWMPVFQRKDKSYVRPEERPTDRDYERYIFLTEWLTRHRDEPDAARRAPFQVVDPLFNAIFVLSCDAWREAAQTLQQDRQAAELDEWAQTIRGAFARLRDVEGVSHWPLDLRTGELVNKKTIHLIAPLLAGACEDSDAELLCERLIAELIEDVRFPVPTTSPEEPDFDPVRYWRGPVWINMQWFSYLALRDHDADAARGLVESTRQLLTDSLTAERPFAEYYHPFTGDSLGAGNLTWTACLALHWILPES